MKLVILVLAVVVGIGGYLVYQAGPPSPANSSAYRQLTTEAACFLQERTCTASGEQSQIKLSLNPQPVPLMKPVQASMQLTGLANIDAIELKIEGMNMYMGFQTVQLVKQNDTDWQGNFSLPICSEREMQWKVTANLSSASQAYQASFSLVTQR